MRRDQITEEEFVLCRLLQDVDYFVDGVKIVVPKGKLMPIDPERCIMIDVSSGDMVFIHETEFVHYAN